MAEATRYTITVGSNTNVTATTYELNDKQLKQLEELVGSGDISLDKTTGVITAKNAHGLVAASAVMGVSFDELMEIDGLSGEIRRGMTHEGVMAAINRFSSSDPEKMSLSELMTCMMMMVYQSESERREALQTAKGAQLLIQMEQARMAWSQSRESAERTFSYAMLSAIGTICSSFISAGMGIAGAGVQGKVSHYKKQIHENKQTIRQKELADQMDRTASRLAKQNADKISAINIINDKDKALKEKQDAYKSLGIDPNNSTEAVLSENWMKQLTKDKEKLETDIENLGFEVKDGELKKVASGVNYDLVDELKNDPTYKQIKALGGEVQPDGTIKSKGSDTVWGENIDVGDLQDQNAKLEARIKELDPLVNGLQQAAVIGNVVSGGFQIGAAYAQKDAAFLQAEADLTRAFQSFSSAMVQNIDQSAQQALQQMEKLASSLKEVFRAMYDIECSIARNI